MEFDFDGVAGLIDIYLFWLVKERRPVLNGIFAGAAAQSEDYNKKKFSANDGVIFFILWSLTRKKENKV